MQQFDYQKELKKLINSKELVEVNLHGAPTFLVAYILGITSEFMTLGVVSSSATFAGVTIISTLIRLFEFPWQYLG